VEEEKKAPAKGKGKAAVVVNEEPEIKMITPDAIVMENENGRMFEFELGRFEDFKVNVESD
jgi:hypothetical protein